MCIILWVYKLFVSVVGIQPEVVQSVCCGHGYLFRSGAREGKTTMRGADADKSETIWPLTSCALCLLYLLYVYFYYQIILILIPMKISDTQTRVSLTYIQTHLLQFLLPVWFLATLSSSAVSKYVTFYMLHSICYILFRPWKKFPGDKKRIRVLYRT